MENWPYEPRLDEEGNPLILSPEEYFAAPAVYHPHHQGSPCHKSCFFLELNDE